MMNPIQSLSPQKIAGGANRSKHLNSTSSSQFHDSIQSQYQSRDSALLLQQLQQQQQQYHQNSIKQLVYTIALYDQQVQVGVPLDCTNGSLVEHVRKLAMLMQSPNAENIACIGTFNNNEVIDYYLTQFKKKTSEVREDVLLTPIYSTRLNKDTQSNSDINILDFTFIKCLGKGGTSEVFLVRHKESCKLFALKMIPKTHLSEFKRLEQLLRERKILIDAAQAPFIVSLHACFESELHLNFLLEFYCGGELFFHLQTRKLSESEAKFYFVEILICFEFLHNRKILYRDLKPENIVLDMEGHVILTDFGLSKIGMDIEELTDSFCGSPEYMAPEVLSREGYNYSVDFYTLGAFLFELVTGLPPFYANNTETILNNIQNEVLVVPDYVNPHLSELLYALLDKQPQHRVNSYEEIKSCAWFNDVNWKDIHQQKIRPPIQININESYIHEEFKHIPVPRPNSRKPNQESLFSFFSYINPASNHLLKRIPFEQGTTTTTTTTQTTTSTTPTSAQPADMESQQNNNNNLRQSDASGVAWSSQSSISHRRDLQQTSTALSSQLASLTNLPSHQQQQNHKAQSQMASMVSIQGEASDSKKASVPRQSSLNQQDFNSPDSHSNKRMNNTTTNNNHTYLSASSYQVPMSAQQPSLMPKQFAGNNNNNSVVTTSVTAGGTNTNQNSNSSYNFAAQSLQQGQNNLRSSGGYTANSNNGSYYFTNSSNLNGNANANMASNPQVMMMTMSKSTMHPHINDTPDHHQLSSSRNYFLQKQTTPFYPANVPLATASAVVASAGHDSHNIHSQHHYDSTSSQHLMQQQQQQSAIRNSSLNNQSLQKRTNTENSASRMQNNQNTEKKSKQSQVHSAQTLYDSQQQQLQNQSQNNEKATPLQAKTGIFSNVNGHQKYLDLDNIKQQSQQNFTNKDKSVDKTALIRSFLKGQLSYSTKNLSTAAMNSSNLNPNCNQSAQRKNQHANHHLNFQSVQQITNSFHGNYSSTSQDQKQFQSQKQQQQQSQQQQQQRIMSPLGFSPKNFSQVEGKRASTAQSSLLLSQKQKTFQQQIESMKTMNLSQSNSKDKHSSSSQYMTAFQTNVQQPYANNYLLAEQPESTQLTKCNIPKEILPMSMSASSHVALASPQGVNATPAIRADEYLSLMNSNYNLNIVKNKENTMVNSIDSAVSQKKKQQQKPLSNSQFGSNSMKNILGSKATNAAAAAAAAAITQMQMLSSPLMQGFITQNAFSQQNQNQNRAESLQSTMYQLNTSEHQNNEQQQMNGSPHTSLSLGKANQLSEALNYQLENMNSLQLKSNKSAQQMQQQQFQNRTNPNISKQASKQAIGKQTSTSTNRKSLEQPPKKFQLQEQVFSTKNNHFIKGLEEAAATQKAKKNTGAISAAFSSQKQPKQSSKLTLKETTQSQLQMLKGLSEFAPTSVTHLNKRHTLHAELL